MKCSVYASSVPHRFGYAASNFFILFCTPQLAIRSYCWERPSLVDEAAGILPSNSVDYLEHLQGIGGSSEMGATFEVQELWNNEAKRKFGSKQAQKKGYVLYASRVQMRR